MQRLSAVVTVLLALAGTAAAQSPPREAARARAEVLGSAAGEERDCRARGGGARRATAAEAHEALGRIYTFKGWQQENVFPGWHDEPAFREQGAGRAEGRRRRRSGSRRRRRTRCDTAEGIRCGREVDPAPPRPEISALDAKLQAADERAGPRSLAAVEARGRERRPIRRRFSPARRC